MDELALSKLAETLRKENDFLFEKIKVWAKEALLTREEYLKDQIEFNKNTLEPLRTKIAAVWLSLGIIGGLSGIVFFFFKRGGM